MRKLMASLIAVLCIAFNAFAQDGFGVVGGVTTSSTQIEDVNFDSITQYHVGLAYKSPNLFGFAVQPELCYNMKGTRSEISDLKMGFVELGLQFQWGPDLVLFRPYVFVEPFMGYAVKNWVSNSQTNIWTNLKRTEAGMGIGGGVELFGALQFSAKHFQNFGEITKDGFDGWSGNFGGWVFSLSLFF